MSLEHSPARDGAPASRKTNRPVGDALAVKPLKAAELMGCGLTRVYQIMKNREVEFYKDGNSTMITTASIRARQQRLIEAARAARTTSATPDAARGDKWKAPAATRGSRG